MDMLEGFGDVTGEELDPGEVVQCRQCCPTGPQGSAAGGADTCEC